MHTSCSFHTSEVTNKFLNNGVATESCPSWSRQIDNYNQENMSRTLSIIKDGSMSSPKEAELQSPLPDNDANLLSLQESF
jgi:hypothetical protein